MANKKKTPKKSQSKKTALTDQQVDEMLAHINGTTRVLLRRHLEGARVATGEILVEDVDYCLKFGDRILAHSKKTQTNTLNEALSRIGAVC